MQSPTQNCSPHSVSRPARNPAGAGPNLLESLPGGLDTNLSIIIEQDTVQGIPHSPILLSASSHLTEERSPFQYGSPWTQGRQLGGSAGLPPPQPLDATRACLLRYFIDQISPWVSFFCTALNRADVPSLIRATSGNIFSSQYPYGPDTICRC